MSKPTKEHPFTFGAIVVDLKHQFFGEVSPSVCVVADMWANESEGDEDVWVDHYRGRRKVTFEDLRDESRWKFTGVYANCQDDVLRQCTLWEEKYD